MTTWASIGAEGLPGRISIATPDSLPSTSSPNTHVGKQRSTHFLDKFAKTPAMQSSSDDWSSIQSMTIPLAQKSDLIAKVRFVKSLSRESDSKGYRPPSTLTDFSGALPSQDMRQKLDELSNTFSALNRQLQATILVIGDVDRVKDYLCDLEAADLGATEARQSALKRAERAANGLRTLAVVSSASLTKESLETVFAESDDPFWRGRKGYIEMTGTEEDPVCVLTFPTISFHEHSEAGDLGRDFETGK